jgi:2-dehydro-3-deoxyglucarate aldolase/4-hydroxy-2-oxoheptanedioate aldolase
VDADMATNFRKRLINGEILIGTVVTLFTPEVSEILSETGFDWLWIDTEHSPFDVRGALGILQAVDEKCPCIIRVPACDDVWIKKALDIGAAGIIVPQVNSPEIARQIVSSCKYPPQGSRGVGVGRAHKYGLKFQDYVETANEEIAVIIQAETREAVENISSIVEVDGIDAVLIGPYDLSASLGKIGQVKDASVQVAMDKIRQSCRQAGVQLGVFGMDAAAVKPYILKGYTLIGVGTDASYLANSAAKSLTELKDFSKQ